jgi:hypothetical protein
MKTLVVDFVGYYFPNKTLWYGITYDRVKNEITYDSPTYPSELKTFPTFKNYNFQTTSARGTSFISPKSANQTYLIVGSPILTTEQRGTDIPGTMLLGIF